MKQLALNYIDTVNWYGQGKSETFLGKALQEVPRNSICIGTKVGRYETDTTNMFDFSAEKVTKSAEETILRNVKQLDKQQPCQLTSVFISLSKWC